MPSKALGDDDRRRATQQAAAARAERAAIKHDLKCATLDLASLLERAAGDPIVARMPVSDVLEALPAHGPGKAAKLMRSVGIAPNRRLGGLGSRQRAELLARLEGRP